MTPKALRSFVAVALVLFAQFADAQWKKKLSSGQPAQQYDYVYLNGIGLPVGGKTYLCDGSIFQWGQQKGVFQEMYQTPCD